MYCMYTRATWTSRGALIKWQAGINQMRRSSGKAIWAGKAGRCGNRSAAVDHRTSRIYLSTPPTLDGDSAHFALTPAIAPIPRSYSNNGAQQSACHPRIRPCAHKPGPLFIHPVHSRKIPLPLIFPIYNRLTTFRMPL